MSCPATASCTTSRPRTRRPEEEAEHMPCRHIAPHQPHGRRRQLLVVERWRPEHTRGVRAGVVGTKVTGKGLVAASISLTSTRIAQKPVRVAMASAARGDDHGRGRAEPAERSDGLGAIAVRPDHPTCGDHVVPPGTSPPPREHRNENIGRRRVLENCGALAALIWVLVALFVLVVPGCPRPRPNRGRLAARGRSGPNQPADIRPPSI
jgi:hypothetical protein